MNAILTTTALQCNAYDIEAVRRYGREPESNMDRINLPRDWRYREVDEGDCIYPSQDGLWRVLDDEEGTGMSVVAGPMAHTMPCVGYVLQV